MIRAGKDSMVKVWETVDLIRIKKFVYYMTSQDSAMCFSSLSQTDVTTAPIFKKHQGALVNIFWNNL